VRADFEAAWRMILPTLADSRFQKWHIRRDRTAPNMRYGNEWNGCRRKRRHQMEPDADEIRR
jgi:hypothetical protein